MVDQAKPQGFAPADLTDTRDFGDWKTRYPDKDAQKAIKIEAWYLAAHLAGVLTLLLLLFVFAQWNPYELSDLTLTSFLKYSHSYLGGILGGTLFAIKWLYHAVGKNSWNLDRRLWRLFTPHVSGALAFVVAALIASEILAVLDADALDARSASLGVGFLVGYFSDAAIAKLTVVAETLFGTSQRADLPTNATEKPDATEGEV